MKMMKEKGEGYNEHSIEYCFFNKEKQIGRANVCEIKISLVDIYHYEECDEFYSVIAEAYHYLANFANEEELEKMQGKEIAYISYIHIEKTQRSKGYMRKMVHALEKEYKGKTILLVPVQMEHDGKKLFDLMDIYEHLGFEKCGETVLYKKGL